jgi:lipoprotein-releasing system permease protein
MSLEGFVARRYLFSRGKETLVWIITAVSVGGVAIGVGALIGVVSVMDGFDRELVDRILGVNSHAILYAYPGGDFKDYEPLVQRLENAPGIEAAAPLIQEQVLMQVGRGTSARKMGAQIRGLDLNRDAGVTRISSSIVKGHGQPGEGEIVLGDVLALYMDADIGDEVHCITSRVRMGGGAGYQVRRVSLKVVGTFKCGIYELDQSVAYVNINEAIRAFLMEEGSCQQIQVKVTNPREIDADKFGMMIGAAIFPEIVRFQTWKQFNPTFFSALELEKIAMFVILLLIVIVAAFNIIGTMIMVVAQKTREIGVLQAVGLTPGMVAGIFIRMGFMLGLLGTGVGASLGTGICLILKYVYPIPLPEEVYNINQMPVVISPAIILLVVGSSMLICLIAAVIPARRASRLLPATALRYE